MTDALQSANEIIRRLNLQPHPEGGHYAEIYREGTFPRGTVSSIYFLLKEGERSHWHRVTDAVEIWAWHAGAPLELSIAANGIAPRTDILGADLAKGQLPQAIVPANAWQAAKSLGAWTLVGCMVAPAFVFENFELAPENWQPPDLPGD